MKSPRAIARASVVVAVLTGAAVAYADGPPAGSAARSAATPETPAPSESGLSSAELGRMLDPLSHDAPSERKAAAAAVAALGPDAVPAIAQKLADLRRGGDRGTSSALRDLHGTKEASFDLVEALVVAKPDASVQRALTIACLIRALAHAGTTPATRQLVLVAPDAGGIFRPELARQMKRLGDRAVPALIEAKKDPSSETRAWAASVLESLGKRTAGDAVQTTDNQVLSDVLRAYALTKELDTLPVILSFVNSDRVQVRTAAREATLAFGQDAIWKLREAYAALTGEQAPEGAPAADVAKKLFDAYDRYRLHDVYALLDQGLASQRDGHLDAAVSAFDQALARQPMLDRRAETAPGYAGYADSLEDQDPARALTYLRKALRVDESGPEAAHARSAIAYLEGEDLVAHGVADTEPFERALALDPKNDRARTALDKLNAASAAGHPGVWRIVVAALVLAVAGAGVFFFGRRRVRATAA